MTDPELLDNFLMAVASRNQFNPSEYMAYTKLRINSLGYDFDQPHAAVLDHDHGDIYVPLSRWGKSGDNKEYINLAWTDGGQHIAANVTNTRKDDVVGNKFDKEQSSGDVSYRYDQGE